MGWFRRVMSWFRGAGPRDDGIYLGQVKGKRRGRPGLVRYRGNKHLITIGPTRSGKGTGIIIPNLAHLRRSILLIDPKGEAAAITGRRRARFGRVVILNPFNVLVKDCPHLQSQGFNPLASLDSSSLHFPDDATGIAEALIRVEGNDPHWSASAQELIAALVMWECITATRDSRPPSLVNVRKMLTAPTITDQHGNPTSGLAFTAIEMATCGYAPLESKAGRFTGNSREIQGIVSTATTQTRFLDSPAIAADLTGSGFDFADMKREIVTVFLILPANYLATHSTWLRLMVQSALRSLLHTPPSKSLPPALFMLDEFAQLGPLPAIENAMAIAAGFGVQLWVHLQDLGQLRALYKRWETFVGSRGALTAFAPQDWFTAEYLAKLCGQRTQIIETWNESDNMQGSGREGRNWSPQGFPLFRPEDLMRMPAGQTLCLLDPDLVPFPFIAHAPGYWNTPFKAGLDPNPYYR